MKNLDVVLIEGLGTPGTSPILGLKPFIPSGVRIIKTFHWKQLESGTVDLKSEFAETSELVAAGHSLGGWATLFLSGKLDGLFPDRIIPVSAYLFDPVTGDIDHPWAQLGADPLLLSPNIVEATDYLRTDFAGAPPFHQPLAYADGVKFKNIRIPGDHNSMVMNAKDLFIEGIAR